MLSNNDLYILRRAMSRMSLDGLKPDNPILAVLVQDDSERGIKLLSDFINSSSDLLVNVMRIDPTTPPPQPVKADSEEIYIPDLPAEARLTDEALKAMESVGAWHNATLQYAKKQSPMTPPHFLEGATFWLAGLLIARRVYLHLWDRIYPHLYLLIVAETSRYAKSTGMNVFYHILLKTFPHMLIPGSTTTEGMIELLSGQQPANYDKLPSNQKELINAGMKFAGQRGIILDEYSSLLGSSKKDYMQGFVELLMRLYDAREQEYHYTKSGGWLTINKPALSIFGATTPAAMARSITHESWENGDLARYLLLFREEVLEYAPIIDKEDTVPEAITKPMYKVMKNLPEMMDSLNNPTGHSPLGATITAEARSAFEAYAKALRHDLLEDVPEYLHGNYTRLPVQALKLAISLATFDTIGNGQDSVKLELGHWAKAQNFIERSRTNIHHLVLTLNESKDARIQRDLLAILKHSTGGLTVRDLCRRTNSLASDIRSSLDILIESGEIEVIEHKPPTGRPTKIYKSLV